MDSDQLHSIIKNRRKERKWTQKDFATKMKRKWTAYNYTENNLDKASLSTIISILDALDLQIVIIPSDQLKK